jgi:hypothetical protein
MNTMQTLRQRLGTQRLLAMGAVLLRLADPQPDVLAELV